MRIMVLLGVVAALVLIALGFADLHAVLAGWLAAFALWSGVPLGALLLTMIAALIPGRWRSETEVQARALVTLNRFRVFDKDCLRAFRLLPPAHFGYSHDRADSLGPIYWECSLHLSQ